MDERDELDDPNAAPTMYVNITAMSPPPKAASGNGSINQPLVFERPITNTMVAPRPAPEATPSR
ncbi:unannotated protein [freshwater metagenome]|uniref:Unannotated protein n=1 Tax=freshwater metagenome TaxID=449393 RepID=A0A6J7CIM8_9ZZZZ